MIKKVALKKTNFSSFWAKTLLVKARQTDTHRQTKTSYFWLPWQRVKSRAPPNLAVGMVIEDLEHVLAPKNYRGAVNLGVTGSLHFNPHNSRTP